MFSLQTHNNLHLVYFQSNHLKERDQLQARDLQPVVLYYVQDAEMGWLDPTDSQLVQDDQDAETRCSDPQKNSYFQCPRQNMPLQEPGLGSDQQHSTNNQASLAVLQSIIGCHGGRTEHAENASDSPANQPN